jgi:hypothetical protein
VLALVSAIQIYFLTRADNTARISADAARRTAMEMAKATDIESPFLYPSGLTGNIWNELQQFIMYDHENSPHDPVTPQISFRVKNYGRNSAIVRSVSADFAHWTDMPEESPRTDIYTDFAVQPILEPKSETERVFNKTLNLYPLDRAAFESIRAAQSRLFVYGEIIYSDIVGNDYLQSFCLAWDFRSRGFIPWFAKYNQRKRRNVEVA